MTPMTNWNERARRIVGELHIVRGGLLFSDPKDDLVAEIAKELEAAYLTGVSNGQGQIIDLIRNADKHVYLGGGSLDLIDYIYEAIRARREEAS